jgi:hypothetical protein
LKETAIMAKPATTKKTKPLSKAETLKAIAHAVGDGGDGRGGGGLRYRRD